MSDKPLAEGIENWAKKLEEEWEIEIAQHLRGTILLIKDFAAEHLTEQTEPSEEIKQKLREVAIDLGHKKADYAIAKLLETTAQWTINAERRRIRELLVGKETK